MITFRCKRSGNTVAFSNEADIAGLRKHEGYEEIGPVENKKQDDQPEQKKRGRPAVKHK